MFWKLLKTDWVIVVPVLLILSIGILVLYSLSTAGLEQAVFIKQIVFAVIGLIGMFAIALWDEREKKLVLARDRMGIKPLFYATLDDQLLFGSEIRAITAAGLPLTLNTDALNYYLSLLYIPAPHTIYNEVHKLKPGYILIFHNGKLETQRYWSLAQVDTLEDYSVQQLQKELRQLLLASVERQLVSDVPLGFFLSGGLDTAGGT